MLPFGRWGSHRPLVHSRLLHWLGLVHVEPFGRGCSHVPFTHCCDVH